MLQLGWAYLGTLESLFGPGVEFCGRLIDQLPLKKIGQMMVLNGVTCKAPVANFGPKGLCVLVGSGAQFRSRLATTYVWQPEKVKCG